jgi:prepilin-type N-terminal cleavage/methylation domain-containing protein
MYPRSKKAKSSRSGFTLVEIMIVVGVIAIIIAITVPAWIRARSQARMKACQENLSKIDGAIQQLALEVILQPSAAITPAMIIAPGAKRGILYQWPDEPSGFEYTVTTVAEEPVCTSGLPGHSLGEVGQAIIGDETAGGGS